MTRTKYPFNFGEHQMLVVIVGRLTEWISSDETVEEDIYSNRAARDYADFVHIRPFYEFSFTNETGSNG